MLKMDKKKFLKIVRGHQKSWSFRNDLRDFKLATYNSFIVSNFIYCPLAWHFSAKELVHDLSDSHRTYSCNV